MNTVRCAASCALAVAILAGCAQTTVTQQQAYQGPRLPRPSRIIVYDFAAMPADLPQGYTIAQFGQPSALPTPEQLQTGRQLGAEVAKQLVAELQSMGLPAVGAAGQRPPVRNDIALIGYFVSVDSGGAIERMVVGFGAGAAELRTVVEAYRMTGRGLERLGSGELDSGGSKGPGVAIPLAVALASGNPVGLAVSGAVKVEGEVSGRTTIEGEAQRTAKEIGAQLKVAAEMQGWI